MYLRIYSTVDRHVHAHISSHLPKPAAILGPALGPLPALLVPSWLGIDWSLRAIDWLPPMTSDSVHHHPFIHAHTNKSQIHSERVGIYFNRSLAKNHTRLHRSPLTVQLLQEPSNPLLHLLHPLAHVGIRCCRFAVIRDTRFLLSRPVELLVHVAWVRSWGLLGGAAVLVLCVAKVMLRLMHARGWQTR